MPPKIRAVWSAVALIPAEVSCFDAFAEADVCAGTGVSAMAVSATAVGEADVIMTCVV